MIVHHLSAATLCPGTARLVNGRGGLFEPGHMVCHCWLVESNNGLILVDTGLGTDDMRDIRGRLGIWFEQIVRPLASVEDTAIRQIEKMGFKPRDVRHVIPTHLDLDHSGGIPDFPDAQVHVFRPEYEAAMRRSTLAEKGRYRPMHWKHGPKWSVREQEGESWFGFSGVRALDSSEEILLIPLVGHTRGHCGVAVKTKTGWLLHAGDAYFFHKEMDTPPKCTVGLRLFQRVAAINNPQRLSNQRRLRELVARHGSEVTVHCAHCPVEYGKLRANGAA